MLREIKEPNSPAGKQELTSFAARHGLHLPRAYEEFLLKNNGGRPIPAGFPIIGLPNNPDGAIQAFFALNASIKSEDLDVVMADLKGLVPQGILPIACTDGDDFVCLDLRKPGQPVVYWDRRQFWGNNLWSEADLYHVTDDFQSFLAALHDV